MSGNGWTGRVLKTLRTRKKLTQGELAKRLQVHRVTIAHLESSTRSPSMALLPKLAKVLKVKVADLLP